MGEGVFWNGGRQSSNTDNGAPLPSALASCSLEPQPRGVYSPSPRIRAPGPARVGLGGIRLTQLTPTVPKPFPGTCAGPTCMVGKVLTPAGPCSVGTMVFLIRDPLLLHPAGMQHRDPQRLCLCAHASGREFSNVNATKAPSPPAYSEAEEKLGSPCPPPTHVSCNPHALKPTCFKHTIWRVLGHSELGHHRHSRARERLASPRRNP